MFYYTCLHVYLREVVAILFDSSGLSAVAQFCFGVLVLHLKELLFMRLWSFDIWVSIAMSLSIIRNRKGKVESNGHMTD